MPVSLIGTFAGMYVLGFSINLLTLFGMVLAIGIVVDDAIVVLENVERIMASEKKGPRDAAIQAMEEVSGPIISIVLVLCAVFIPVSFLGGLAGQLYRQFAVTIAVSVVISGIVALTLSPALCAILLKPERGEPWAPFRWFNRGFDWVRDRYSATVAFFLRHALIGIAVVAVMVLATWQLFERVPGGLIPAEDQGYVFLVTNLPPAASLDRTRAITSQVTEGVLKNPAVQTVVTLSGFDFLSGAQKTNAGVSFVSLKDWSERKDPREDARNLAPAFGALNANFKDGVVIGFNPPPIQGIGTTGGFEFFLQDRTGGSLEQLAQATQKVVAAANQRPELQRVSTTFSTNVPQYRINVDREKAKALGVAVSDIFDAMQSTFGSLYVNDFTLFDRTFHVSLSSEGQFRESPEDLQHVYVRASSGAMVPLNVLATTTRVSGPDVVDRFNIFPAARVQGNAAPGYSSGQAIQVMTDVVKQTLGNDYTIGWTGAAYQELSTAGTGYQGFIFGLVFVFLILAAQYERWSLPLAVITAVPFAVFGAIVAIWLRGIENDIYFQIGLVTLIGLAAKNAILIVEFAVERYREGKPVIEAAEEGARLRFRPIIMTSLAFILGVTPLAISTGAGSASRHSIGTGVIGGMLAATFIATLLVPLFFRLATPARREAEPQPAPTPARRRGRSNSPLRVGVAARKLGACGHSHTRAGEEFKNIQRILRSPLPRSLCKVLRAVASGPLPLAASAKYPEWLPPAPSPMGDLCEKPINAQGVVPDGRRPSRDRLGISVSTSECCKANGPRLKAGATPNCWPVPSSNPVFAEVSHGRGSFPSCVQRFGFCISLSRDCEAFARRVSDIHRERCGA